MIRYQVCIPPEVARAIGDLSPELKKAVRAALTEIESSPFAGTPLQAELAGCLKVKVRRYRIVYRVERPTRKVLVLAIGHRRSIYEDLADERRKER